VTEPQCPLMTQSGHDPYAASTFGFEKPIATGSKMVFDRNRLRQVALLCGIAYLGLSTFSASEDADVTSGQLVFNNACRTCHSVREGDFGLALTCEASSEGRLGRCQTTRIPAL
jgi:hypothetical protein